jgi:hypothetical protein
MRRPVLGLFTVTLLVASLVAIDLAIAQRGPGGGGGHGSPGGPGGGGPGAISGGGPVGAAHGGPVGAGPSAITGGGPGGSHAPGTISIGGPGAGGHGPGAMSAGAPVVGGPGRGVHGVMSGGPGRVRPGGGPGIVSGAGPNPSFTPRGFQSFRGRTVGAGTSIPKVRPIGPRYAYTDGRRYRHHRHGPGFAYGYGVPIFGYYDDYYNDYSFYDDCYRWRRVWTRHGWRLRRVYVCYYPQ